MKIIHNNIKMSNDLKIIPEQDRRLEAYLGIELNILEDNCRNYPVEIPTLYKKEERQMLIRKSKFWFVQFDLLSRIKKTIKHSMKEGSHKQVIGYLKIEFETVETSWRNLPLPVPSMYSPQEKEDYLSRRELLEAQCNLLERILKVTESCIVDIR
ncbi:hypothetical protein V9L05_17690 [Bernardetia sp. Wsw4-3y2]|uniref:hypothetical protein n=1 Tax=Bernardetia sp. Wsw4-3y2 TaxID=3127471 RepID=UPI0030CF151E